MMILCGWLAIWQPLTMAIVAAEGLAALPIRGWPLGLLLTVRLGATAVGLAAARALWEARAGAVALTKTAIVLSGLLQLFVYGTTIAPSNRKPGDTPYFVAITVAVHGAWLVYLARSARIRELDT